MERGNELQKLTSYKIAITGNNDNQSWSSSLAMVQHVTCYSCRPRVVDKNDEWER